MANSLVGDVWYCDTLGILTSKPIWVRGIMYYPAAVDGECTLRWWAEDTTIDLLAKTYSVATSGDDTITSTGNFPDTWLDGNVVKIGETTGSDKNTHGLIKTAGNTNAIVIHGSPFTQESNKVGDFYQFTSYVAFKAKASKAADTETSMWFPFGGERGFMFPNLAFDDCDTSDVVLIYLG